MASQTTEETEFKPVVIDWRDTAERDPWGMPLREVLVEGVGWCRYSWRQSMILIRGDWYTY